MLLLFSNTIFCQNRYWVATTSSNWNSNNWSVSSGGTADGLGPPSLTQTAVFDGNNTADCTVDMAVTIESIELNNGYTGTLNLNSNNFTVNGITNNTFADGIIADLSNTSSLTINTAGRTNFSGTTFNLPLSVLSDRVYFNGGTFNSISNINKTGTGNDYSSGGNTFNADVSIINSGTGYLAMGGSSADVFNSNLTVYNYGTNIIYLANNSVGNQFNGNVCLNATSGQGIRFGQGSSLNSSTLASGKYIYIGSDNFTSGNLELRNFTQAGAAPQTLNIGGTSLMYIEDQCVFNGAVNFSAPQIHSNGVTYNNTVILEKTGAGNNYSTGNNLFNNSADIINSGSGNFVLGNLNPDIFNSDLMLTNNGSGSIYLAYNSSGNTIAGNLDILNIPSATNAHVYLSSVNGSSLNISGTTTVDNNGSGATNTVHLGYAGSVYFSGLLNLQNRGIGANSAIYLNNRLSSTNNYAENILVTSTSGQGIRFGEGGGAGVLSVGKTISLGISGFSSGMLRFQNFTQTGSTPHVITLTGTGYIFNMDSDFGGNVSFTAPRIYSRSTNYQGTLFLEKTGSISDYSYGGNVVAGDAEIINSGSSYFLFGNNSADLFNADLTLENKGSSNLYIANNGTGHQVNGNLIINQTASGSNSRVYLANGGTSNLIIAGTSTVINNATGTDNAIYLGYNGDITFTGIMDLQNIGSGNNSAIYLNYSSNSTNTYSESISVTSTSGQGVRFGQNDGTGIFAAGKTIMTGTAGFSSGNLMFRNFNQLGSTPQNLTLTGSGHIYNRGSDWGGNVNFIAPRMYTWATNYRGTVYLEKTGGLNDYSPGGNTISGNTELVNSGSSYFLMGNGTADVFNGDLRTENSGTSNLYIAHGGSGHQVLGDLTVNQIASGANSSTYFSYNTGSDLMISGTTTVTNNGIGNNNRIYLAYNGSIAFNNFLTLQNIGTGNNSSIYLNMGTTGANSFNENIEVSSTSGQGVRFGEYGGSGTLAATKTITVGTGGFSAGYLRFRNFNQVGSTAQNITLSGTGYFYNWDSDWGGDVTFTAPRMYTRGTNYQGQVYLEKTGASNDASLGGNTIAGNTQLVNSGSSYFLMGNGTADIFGGNLDVMNLGTGNMYIANNGPGHLIGGDLNVSNLVTSTNTYVYFANGNTSTVNISGNSSVINNGTGGNNRIYLGYSGSMDFNGLLDLQNIGTGNNSAIYLNLAISSANFYRDDITIVSSAGQGIRFGDNGGSGTLSALKTISVGAAGFSSGMLRFRNFTQIGPTPQNITLSGTGYFYNRDSDWGGDVNFIGERMYTANTNYQGNVYLEKTGSSNDYSPGGNTVSGNTQIVNTSSNYLSMGNGTADVFNGNLDVLNSGTSSIFMAQTGAGHFVGGNLFINQTASGNNSNTYFSNNDNSSTLVNGTATAINNSLGTNSRIYLGYSGDMTFNSTLDLKNIGSGTNSAIYLNYRPSSLNVYNESITLESSGGQGIRFGEGGGGGILAATKTVSVPVVFSSGYLRFRNFTQTGNTTQNIALTNTATFYNYDSDWGGDVNFSGPSFYTRGTIYRETAYLEKTGVSSDYSNGGNVFDKYSEIVNSGDGLLSMGVGSPDIFNMDLLIRNTGQNRLYIAHSSAGNQFNGKVHFYNYATDNTYNECQINNGTVSTSTFADSVIIVNGSTGYNRFQVSRYGQATFNGPVILKNHGTHNNNAIYCNSNSSGCIFNSNITVESDNGQGIFFGQGGGSSTLNAGNTISVGVTGFSTGQLYLRNFIQLGNSAQNMTLTGTAYLTHYGSQWNGVVHFVSPRHYLRSSVFNGDAYLEKSGGFNDYSFGGCIFNGVTTMHNSSNARFIGSNNSANDFNGHVTYRQSGNGSLYPAYNRPCTYAGDINIDFIASQQVLFASNANGRVILDGNADQNINDLSSSQDPLIRRLEINKAGGVVNLNTAASISHELELLSGIVNNNTANLLTMFDNSVVSAVSDASYISGPVEKVGNDVFTFPVGKGGYYRAIGITAPNSGNARFRGEYFLQSPDASYNILIKEPTLEEISYCEYWMLDRVASTNNVEVTLSWNDNTSCGQKNLPALKVARWDGTMWRDHGNSNITANTISTAGPVTNFSPFTLTQFIPQLPVELISFEAERRDPENVELDWVTATEENNAGFEIERMLDNESSFTTVGWEDGNGNSLILRNYNYVDENNYSGVSYYRLKQLDFDGSFSYSDTRAVSGMQADIDTEISVFPNPVQDILQVRFGNLPKDCKFAHLLIVGTNGQIVKELEVDAKSYQTLQINEVQNWPSAMYSVNIKLDSGEEQSVKFVKE